MEQGRSLKDPITKLDGVGATIAKKVSKLGIKTVGDLLTYFPFRFNDFSIANLANEPNGAKITIKGMVITHPNIKTYGYKRSRFSFRLLVGHGFNSNKIWVNFFNQPWLAKKVNYRQEIIVYGRLNYQYRSLNASKILTEDTKKKVEPIYNATRKIKQDTIRKLIKQAYQQYGDLIHNYLPPKIQHHYLLENEKNVIHDMQFPKDMNVERTARRTAKFEDFFLFEMKLQMLKQKSIRHSGVQINYNQKVINNFLKTLPFKLTDAQTKCANQIKYDLAKPKQMNRLLQGDVGSGKTIVAAIAILATITAGYQAAIMVPTGVLAKQHVKNFKKTFKGMGINVQLLVSDFKIKHKRNVLKKLANGKINLIIGTEALIAKDAKYHKLGLAVIDEQHRFGVDQRQALRKKGKGVNMLAMTATPIPRTLAITTYGDMDVSVINQLPKGRKPVITRWARTSQVHALLPFIASLMEKGQQIYVVAPLVKQTKHTAKGMYDAETIYHALQYYFEPKFKIALLHGKMDDDQKDKVMADFKAHKYDMLVATTVIEVGVDVSDASLMMIFNADHFGLSQLHQLRGRVGRGSQQAYCLLVADPKNKDGVKRMRVMESTTNGFKISEADLKLRGSGNLLGEAQSGIPKFKVGDPIGDRVILSCAQQEAEKVVSDKNWQAKPENQALIRKLRENGSIKMLD